MIAIFTHRPLFDLAPQWDWATQDGSKAIDLLQHWKNVTVFYGHLHQEHHFKTGEILAAASSDVATQEKVIQVAAERFKFTSERSASGLASRSCWS